VFWGLPNVMVTHHQGGFHDGYANEALPIIQINLQCLERGEVDNMINMVKVAQASAG
jgi:hypothetical protein